MRFLTRAALAPLHAQQGYAAESMRLLREAVVGWHDQGSLNNVAWSVEFGVSAFNALGYPDVAAVASGILDAGIIVTAVRPGDPGQRYRETQAEMRRHLGGAEFERLHAQGAEMTYDEAIAFLLTHADEVAQNTNPDDPPSSMI